MKGIIAAVAIVVVVGVVVVFASSGKPPTPTVAPVAATGSTPPAENADKTDGPLLPVKRVLEAESPTTMDKMSKDGTEVLHVKTVSEGAEVTYLEVDNGFIDRCNLASDKATPGKLPGRASYEFDVPRKDTYYVYLRAKWRDNCGNSAWVGVDDNKWYNLEDEEGQEGEKNYKWAWHPLWVSGAPKAFELTAGKHTLWFNVREDGPKLDQWLISTDAQKPVGFNPAKKSQ